ncbi:MAG: sel1 repeat family protein, partial [Victivallales bacterium]|nr:sel1 repeat family protein [Victivallales bacterium]
PAQFQLAGFYAGGIGTDVDEKEAFKYYKYAADNGDIASCYAVGMRYFYGIGTEKDKEAAKDYWTRAAGKGNEEAALKLKECFPSE